MFLFLMLGISPSVAADVPTPRGPTQCDAVFIAPTGKSCQIDGNWAVTASARSGSKAQELALERLREVVELEIQVRLGQATIDGQDLMRPRLAGCASAAVDSARLYCDDEPRLSEKEYCFASFEDKSCWKGLGIEITDKPSWKAREEGRTDICESVESWMIEQGTDKQTRDECMLSCLQTAKVACRQF
jgi:hypothetical protein